MIFFNSISFLNFRSGYLIFESYIDPKVICDNDNNLQH